MEKTFPAANRLLTGHTSPETAYVVDDYPYGFTLRCKIRYWIETKGQKQRFVSQTTNPKKNYLHWNNPNQGTYSPIVLMYLDEKNKVQSFTIQINSLERFTRAFHYIQEVGLQLPLTIQNTLRKWYLAEIKTRRLDNIEEYKTPEEKKEFNNWIKETIKHVKTCEFKNLLSHNPEPPANQ